MSDSKIQVVPYDPAWPHLFQKKAQKIAETLGSNCITIHHVGSTAIPGLWAKPIIDMIPVVKDIFLVNQKVNAMQELGYIAKGEHGMLFRRYFQRTDPLPACNVHVYEEGSGEIERLTLFRDYLNQHDNYKQRYAALKRNLSDIHSDITKYTLAKEALINEIDVQTGFKGYRMVHALTEREWETYHKLLKTNSSHPMIKDANNQHIVLYQGTEVIGAALITKVADQQTMIKQLVIDHHSQQSDAGSFFTKSLERWLSNT
jgi:GrpB-like predicted nucleotidyltransferase (UPF0157 family)